jgi:hypothetical protein
MSKILGANWRTSVASFATAALGFVAMSPEFFAHWPLLIAIAKYAALGGLVAFGISAKDTRG